MPIARYWRFNITAVDGGSLASAGEFQLYSSTDGTGTNLCLGKTAAQTGDSSVGIASGANDGNINSEAGSTFTGSYIWSVDLGSPGFVGSAGIVAQRVVPNRTATNFTVEYSSDNSNWQIASSHTGETGWVEYERRTFVVDSSSVGVVYEGSIKQITVPANATSAVVRMWGGGGGSGGDGSGVAAKGGAGGFLKFTTAVTAGETLTAIVGAGGLKGTIGGQSRRPGSGGGMSGLLRGNSSPKSPSLMLHMNGSGTTFIDNSPNNVILTTNGDAQLSTVQSKFGGSSGLFSGTGYLTAPDSSNYDLNADFTVEAWLYFNSTADACVLSGSSTGSFDFSFVGNEIRIGRINVAFDSSAPFARSTGVWYHVAWCRRSGTLRFFVDGQIVGSASNSIAYEIVSGHNLVVGAAGLTERRFNGYIEELRVIKDFALYSAAFVPPTSAFSNDNTILGLVGAGGGGGGIGQGNQYSWGGSGGDTSANPGGDALSPSFATGGGGGTQIAGGVVGTPGTGLNGSYLQGGAGAGYDLGTQSAGGWPNGGAVVQIDERGGGGGGGYYGGGGGGGQGTHGAGGGGGSSYTDPSVTSVVHTKTAANDTSAPGTAETGYISGIAEGGLNLDDGSNGLIFIEYVFANFSVSGTVYDSSNNPASRVVRLYSRSTGNLMAQTTSNGTTGAYSFGSLTSTDEVQVVCLDDSGGSLENDLVHRTFPV